MHIFYRFAYFGNYDFTALFQIGGWLAVFALIFVSYVCYRTGLSLIDCLYEDEKSENDAAKTNDEGIPILSGIPSAAKQKKRVKVRHSYRDIAEAVRPGFGKYVLAAQLTELASTCILYLVLAGDLLQGCVPSVGKA